MERAVALVASRLVDPVLTDVRLRADGDVRLARTLPQQPVDLFAGQDLVLLTRYSGHGQARIVFEGRRHGRMVRWTQTEDFPDRERGNPFVARLWATQRVGWLSAEKRKNGGSSEIDDEIRQLGERFGIPTEFTSYLVQEPGIVAGRNAPVGTALGGARPSAAPMARRERAFEDAKDASVLRSTVSIAGMDSARAASAAASAGERDLQKAGNGSQAVRIIDSRTFALRDGVWTDLAYRPGATNVRTVRIKAFSKAYFDLIGALPELRAVFALGDRVVVKGRGVAILVGESGSEEADVRAIVRDW